MYACKTIELQGLLRNLVDTNMCGCCLCIMYTYLPKVPALLFLLPPTQQHSGCCSACTHAHTHISTHLVESVILLYHHTLFVYIAQLCLILYCYMEDSGGCRPHPLTAYMACHARLAVACACPAASTH
jgi:hypothetical protein